MSSNENRAKKTPVSVVRSKMADFNEKLQMSTEASNSNCVVQERGCKNIASSADYEIGEWKQECVSGSKGPNTRTSRHAPIRKLFVANIPTKASAYDLQELFSSFGKILDVYISRNAYSEVRKNFGFVTFLSPDDARRALIEGSFVLFHRDLIVAPADLHHQPVETKDGYLVWRHFRWTLSGKYVPLSERGSYKRTPIKVSVETVDESQCFINTLNDDCLALVFKYLNKTERIKIERVCSRWQHVSKMLWSDTKVLKVADIFTMEKKIFPDLINMECLLSRCGRYLTNLDMSTVTHLFTAKVIPLIAIYCTQLRHLNISGIPVNKRVLQQLGEHRGPELLSLHMENCHGVNEKNMTELFNVCTSLELVNLSRTKQLLGKCLSSLPANTLKVLMVSDCNNIRSALLINSLRRLKNLKILAMNCCINLSNYDIAKIVEAVPQLTEFSMQRYFPFIHKSAVASLHLLTNLVSLDVQLNTIFDDAVLKNLGKSCINIRYLNITGCGISPGLNGSPSLTDSGICSLLKLPNLETLIMSYLGHVTDVSLEVAANHPKVKHLECRGCPTFTDRGCSRLISGCAQLEHFDFSGCHFVTNATVQTAVDVVKQRTNDTELYLVVGGTGITADESFKNVPLLHISYVDFCVPHLRPDFIDAHFFYDDFVPFDFDGDDVSAWGLCEPAFNSELFSSGDSDDDFEDYDVYEFLDEDNCNRRMLGLLY